MLKTTNTENSIDMFQGIGVSLTLLLMFSSQCNKVQSSPYFDPSWIDDLLTIDYDVKCKMQPNSYDCTQWRNSTAIPRYYYDIRMQTCLTFDYHECKVSLNNFLSLFECNEHCRQAGPRRISANKSSVYCRLQPDFGDCHNYHPMYYYDITTRSCKGFSYGGCGGNRNKFENAQQCVAVCSGIINFMT